MRVEAVHTRYFAHDGRGPELVRWLHQSDQLFEGTFWTDTADDICGADYAMTPLTDGGSPPSTSVVMSDPGSAPCCWVIFHGLQVLQLVPEEVHSHYHREHCAEATGAWRVHDSPWLTQFHPRHLADHQHFILEFYDELVEVIALDLIFGAGTFHIHDHASTDPRFVYAHLRRAQVREKAGDLVGAIEDYGTYARLVSSDDARYPLRCIDSLRRKLDEGSQPPT